MVKKILNINEKELIYCEKSYNIRNNCCTYFDDGRGYTRVYGKSTQVL
jgi:hypothetical protein